MLDSSEDEEEVNSVSRRQFLDRILRSAGGASLAGLLAKAGLLTSLFTGFVGCTGAFEVIHLNNASPYQGYYSNANIKKIRIAYLNAADLRGNTTNIWKFVSRSKIKWRAKELARLLLKMEVDAFFASEMDYKETLKTGYLNEPEIVARYMGDPFNYVVFDQYYRSKGWTTGNAVVSRFPMKAIHRHIFGKRWWIFGRWRHVYKDFIHVGLKVGRRHLESIVNHFDDGLLSVRMDEAEEVLKYVTHLKKKDPKCFIVAPGDYNSGHNSKPMKKLLSNGVLVPPPNFGLKTYQSHAPKKDIDHILSSSNLKITNYETFYYPWSDHRGLVCDAEFID